MLRASKAFLFAVPINCIGIGYVMLAAVKVVGALGFFESFGLLRTACFVCVCEKRLL